MQNLDIDNLDWGKIDTKIPKEDYINSSFDYTIDTPVKNILVLFSTPRSGSTLLCDLLYKNQVCIPHEYFQIDEYLPILSKRWGCTKENEFNKQLFIDNLIKRRTSPKGWLGINLHGEHLPLFSSFKSFFPDVNYHFIHIVRRNVISQAISYEIAMQTGKWSSYFSSEIKPEYSFEGIKNKLKRINEQNNLIQSYIHSNSLKYTTLNYEDLVKAPMEALNKVFLSSEIDKISIETSLKKQSSSINRDWLERFSKEYYDSSAEIRFPANSVKKTFFKTILARLL